MATDKHATVDEYIGSFPEDIQEILEQVRATIRAVVPDAEEKISYAIPTFALNGNLVHYAAFKNHIGFYPAPTGSEAFKEELAGYKTGKGSVQFPIDKPMPLELITKIVQFRLRDMQQRLEAKKK